MVKIKKKEQNKANENKQEIKKKSKKIEKQNRMLINEM